MTDELKFKEESLQELKVLMDSPAFNVIRRQSEVRNWRNETQADWVTNFMQRMQLKDQERSELDPVTGKPHTVESKVDEMRDRVKLDSIEKQAALSEVEAIPLSQKMVVAKKKDHDKEATKQNIQRFIEDHYSSHRGHADEPAVLYALREKFGEDTIGDFVSFVKKVVKESKERYKSPSMTMVLPSPYQGQPMKADPQGDMFQPLFENINNI